MKTQQGHENTLESTMNGFDVHFEEGLNLFGVGVKSIDAWMSREAYFSLMAEYYRTPKLKPVKTPNLYRFSNPYLFMNNANQIHDSWEKKRTDNDGTYIYAYTDINMGSETYNSFTTFKIPPTADKNSYDWLRNQGGTNANQNNNTMGFRFKPNTTYTWRFKMRTHYKGYNSQLTTFVGSGNGAGDVNSIVDTTKPYIVNGKEYEWKSTDGRVEWHRVFGQDYMNKQTSNWTICEFQFTTLPDLKADMKQTYRWRFFKNTCLDISESMIYEGENTLNPRFAMTTQENWEYNYYRGRQGVVKLYPNIGFYYSKDYDFACAYKVNVNAGIQVNGFNPNTQEFNVTMEIDNFVQVTNVDVKYYKDADSAPKDLTLDNTIMHSNMAQQERWLRAKAKGGLVDVFETTNEWRPQTMTGTWHMDTWNKDGWGTGGWFYTGDLDYNDTEN